MSDEPKTGPRDLTADERLVLETAARSDQVAVRSGSASVQDAPLEAPEDTDDPSPGPQPHGEPVADAPAPERPPCAAERPGHRCILPEGHRWGQHHWAKAVELRETRPTHHGVLPPRPKTSWGANEWRGVALLVGILAIVGLGIRSCDPGGTQACEKAYSNVSWGSDMPVYFKGKAYYDTGSMGDLHSDWVADCEGLP